VEEVQPPLPVALVVLVVITQYFPQSLPLAVERVEISPPMVLEVVLVAQVAEMLR
jgi:hypothetical protein